MLLVSGLTAGCGSSSGNGRGMAEIVETEPQSREGGEGEKPDSSGQSTERNDKLSTELKDKLSTEPGRIKSEEPAGEKTEERVPGDWEGEQSGEARERRLEDWDEKTSGEAGEQRLEDWDEKASGETGEKRLEDWDEKASGEAGEQKQGDSEGKQPGQTRGQKPEEAVEEAAVKEDGTYNTKEEVALYLHIYGHLPDNYITKKEAQDMGWDSKKGNLDQVAPGMSIGGNRFGNYEGLLPEKKGRKYYECDLEYEGGYRGAKRLIYSNDGLIFYTEDHYQTFEQLY